MSRLELPPQGSLFATLLSSSVGFVALLLIYAANIYAAYEIAIVRARPIGMVMGVAAVLPILGPIIFLSLPMRTEAPPDETQTAGGSANLRGAGRGGAGGGRPVHDGHPRRPGGGEGRAPGSPGVPARPVHVQPPVF